MDIKKLFNIFKYRIVRFIESKPTINLMIMNNIRFLKFLLPHDKDYLGMKLVCKKQENLSIIDVGGNIGTSILSFRQMGFKNKIFVFEPNKNLVDQYLNKLLKKDKKIEVFNFALGNENTTQDIFVPYYNKKCLHYFASFIEDYVKNSINITYPDLIKKIEIKKEKFHIRRYDDLKVDIKPFIIKIDAEGFEHEIIKGMMKMIKIYKPIFLIEYNDENFLKVANLLNNYIPHIYNIKLNTVEKISKEKINNYYIARTNKYNDLSSRNVYFLTSEIN